MPPSADGLIGLLGLWWTELGMWIGVSVLGGYYVPVKIVVTGVVLLWNYLGRKILIFNSRKRCPSVFCHSPTFLHCRDLQHDHLAAGKESGVFQRHHVLG